MFGPYGIPQVQRPQVYPQMPAFPQFAQPASTQSLAQVMHRMAPQRNVPTMRFPVPSRPWPPVPPVNVPAPQMRPRRRPAPAPAPAAPTPAPVFNRNAEMP